MAAMQRKVTRSKTDRSGPICLALIGMLALVRLRLACEHPLGVLVEGGLQMAVLLTAWFLQRGWADQEMRQHNSYSGAADDSRSQVFAERWRMQLESHGLVALATIVLTITAIAPWLIEMILRAAGQGTGLELIMLSSFGWTTLAASLLLQRRRALSTTVICSGFLTLLATCSSDQSMALVFAYIWGAMCLWWLASSHWQRIASCQASTVTKNSLSRPLIVLLGCLVFFVSAWSVAGRFPDSRKLNYELAPTSGGTSAQDSRANGGVGDGDAVIAAREHAASFGAVDSDVFLDSEEPSLFDLYSDTFGEPVRKNKVERTIALAPEQTELSQPEKMSQSDEASSKLTTQRRGSTFQMPLKPKVSDALLFWIGRHDMHLPLQRYGQFDGRDWLALKNARNGSSSQPPAAGSKEPTCRPVPQTINNRVWFSSPNAVEQMKRRHSTPFVGAESEAVKFARLRSNGIPSPAGMASWHIDKIDDPTMFALDDQDNLTMPGRERVPEFTIVRFVNRQLDIEQIEALGSGSVSQGLITQDDTQPNQRGHELARKLLEEWLGGHPARLSRWQQIVTVVDHLRQEFQLDRGRDFSNCDDPVEQFLTEKAGSDLMFATVAAGMLQQLGIQSRLVTGFVARHEHRLGWTREIAVYPDDMHAWLEVCLYPGCWLPLEPTPGYPEPPYHITWRYWVKYHAWSIALGCALLVASGWLVWWQRARVFDLGSLMFGWCMLVLSDRQRCRWVLRLLDTRSRLIGKPRPAHVSPRIWYGPLLTSGPEGLNTALQQMLLEADRMWFGNAQGLTVAGRRACAVLWYQTTCQQLQRSGL